MKIKKPNGDIIKTPSTFKKEAEYKESVGLPSKLENTKKDLSLGIAEVNERMVEENLQLKVALAESYENNLMTKLELQTTIAELIEMVIGEVN